MGQHFQFIYSIESDNFLMYAVYRLTEGFHQYRLPLLAVSFFGKYISNYKNSRHKLVGLVIIFADLKVINTAVPELSVREVVYSYL